MLIFSDRSNHFPYKVKEFQVKRTINTLFSGLLLEEKNSLPTNLSEAPAMYRFSTKWNNKYDFARIVQSLVHFPERKMVFCSEFLVNGTINTIVLNY